MKTIYCISGLGADQRVFSRLAFPDTQLVPVPWADFDKHDDLPCYAQKMAYGIPDKAPTILGVSFGGMVACEIIRQNPTAKVIIVSSAKDVTELPPIGRFLQFVAKRGIAPVGLLKGAKKQMAERFGAHTDDEKALLSSIMADTDNNFMRWAMKAMIEWKTTTHDPGIVHIHGTADKIIVPDKIHPTHWVEGGEHLMVYTRAAEIKKLIAVHL